MSQPKQAAGNKVYQIDRAKSPLKIWSCQADEQEPRISAGNFSLHFNQLIVDCEGERSYHEAQNLQGVAATSEEVQCNAVVWSLLSANDIMQTSGHTLCK